MEVLRSSTPSALKAEQSGPEPLALHSLAAPSPQNSWSGCFPPQGAGARFPPSSSKQVTLSRITNTVPLTPRGSLITTTLPASSSGVRVKAGRPAPQPPGPEGGGGKAGGGVGFQSPPAASGRGIGGAALVPGAHSRRPAQDWRERRGRGALRGRGRRTARSSRPAASMGRRQRPPAPAPRKHSPRRAAPTRGIEDSAELRNRRCSRRREAGPEWGPGAAREPEGRGGLEKATGPERRPGAPRSRIGPAAAVWGQGLSPPAGQGTGPGPRP